MATEELTQALQEIGLSDKEARVYLALLELGQESVQKVAEKADVNRATTYVILESLMSKGLVTSAGEDKKTIFIAEGPYALNNIISEQEEQVEKKEIALEDVMPELSSIFNLHPNKPVVRFYEGKEGLKNMLLERQKDQPEEVRVFYPQELVKNLLSKEEIDQLRAGRIQKKITNKVIYSNALSETDIGAPLLNQKIAPEEIDFSSDIEIWNDKVLIASLAGTITGVIIESKEIAETLRNLFELCFEKSLEIEGGHEPG